MNNFTVYKHIFPNNKVYIGITLQEPKKRWQNGEGYQSQFVYKAIQKYGWDNIKHEIIFTDLTQEEAEQKERELISLYDSANPEHGYNIDLGGSHQGKTSQETRKKLSLSKIGNTYGRGCKGKIVSEETRKKIGLAGIGRTPWNKGKPCSEETKKRLLLANKGRHPTEETKKKLSIANKGKTPWNKGVPCSEDLKRKLSLLFKGRVSPWKGGKHTKEAIEKIRKASTGRKMPLSAIQKTSEAKYKAVYQLTLDNKIINKFNSIKEAANKLNLHKSSICNCCKGKLKSTGGYKWAYA